jgi:hypothetical protein
LAGDGRYASVIRPELFFLPTCAMQSNILYMSGSSVKRLPHMPAELKTAQVNLRLQPSLKAAAEKAAAADRRSLTSLIERLLADYCKKHGFLK